MADFIIAKPGKNALEANPEDDYVTTKQPILKVVTNQKGSITMTAADALTIGTTLTIPHGLDYKPFTQVFAERKPAGNFRIVLSTNQEVSDDVIYVLSWVTDTALVIQFTSFGADPSGVYRYAYYIFGDESEVDG